MKKIIGIIMLALPFIAIFAFVAIMEGILWMLVFLGAIAFVLGWLYVGFKMIESNEEKK